MSRALIVFPSYRLGAHSRTRRKRESGSTTATCETIVKQIGSAWYGDGASTGFSLANNVVDIVASAEGWEGGQ